MADRLFLDDLHVGQRFTSTSHVVDADQIKRFAAEFDPQPFHLDEDAAANSLFAGLATSGWHTAALTMRLLLAGRCSAPVLAPEMHDKVTAPTARRRPQASAGMILRCSMCGASRIRG